MKLFSYIIVLAFALCCSSCKDRMLAYGDDAREIETFLTNELVNDRPHLKIRSEALSKDFMLYGAFIPMLNSPTGHSLKGRIIRFEVSSDHLIMLESPKGHSLGVKEDSHILLADFPIVRKDEDGVVIDFAKGMTTAFTMRNVHARSVSEKPAPSAEQFRAISLSASFIKSIERDQDVLTVNQIAQWRNEKSELVSAEFRYYFREYRPDQSYEKKTFGKQRWVQYFSTPPLIEPPTTNPFAYITKWNITRPIVFHISANTPPQYRDAIKDGLLFWNHIFGKNVIEVRDLDPNIQAPHPELNILQWVTWDNEASAYADMVVDHLTGQIVQAQIYLRSGWVIESARKLKNHLEELLVAEQFGATMPAVEEDVPLPSMFDREDPCLKTMGSFEEIADLATRLSENQISKELLTILTSDILRAVIAHEMGHVLGLRHNLAASTAASMTLEERADILKAYLRSGEYDFDASKFFSRSIMDVFTAGDDAMVGAQMRKLMQTDDVSNSRLRTIYRYDQQAIDFGYRNQAMQGDTVFCTDEDIQLYIDCRRWDAGSASLQFNSERLNNMMTQIAIILADTVITSIDPKRPGGPLRIDDIPLTSRNVMKVLEVYAKELYVWFNKNSRAVAIEAVLPAYGPQGSEQAALEKFKTMRAQLEKKDTSSMLFGVLPPFRGPQLSADALTQTFRAHFLVRLSELMRDNPGFSLSPEDQEKAIGVAKLFLESMNKEVINLILSIVAKMQFDDKDYQLPIEDALGKIARELILATTDTDTTKALPQFRYDLKTRELGVQILNPALGILPDWSFDNLSAITNELKQQMRRAGGATDAGSSINMNALSREQRQWLLEQNRLLSALTQIRSLVRKLHTP